MEEGWIGVRGLCGGEGCKWSVISVERKGWGWGREVREVGWEKVVEVVRGGVWVWGGGGQGGGGWGGVLSIGGVRGRGGWGLVVGLGIRVSGRVGGGVGGEGRSER